MRKMCVFIFCFSVTVAAFAQQAKTFTSTGKIVDSDARPVGGAEVVCFERFYDYGEGRRRCEVLGQARTNEEGRFSMDVKVTRKRSVLVVVRKQGLSLGWAGGAYDSADLDFTIQLDKPKVLAGTVVDESGAAIADAKVQVCLVNDIMGRQLGPTSPVPESWYTTRTDARGGFSFDNIPPDATADFWVESPEKACIWTFWEADNAPAMQFDAGRSDVRIVLIMGRVVDEDTGDPVGGIQLLARPDTRQANYYCVDLVSSDEDGVFCFKGMPAGTYSLQLVPPREKLADWTGKDVKVTLEEGQTLDDVKVTVSKGAIFEVLARDGLTNEPITGIAVSVSQEANYGRHPCYRKSVVTDSRGKARFRVPIGQCSVGAGSSKYAYYRDQEPTQVAKGAVTRREIQLDRNPSVSGIVRDKNGRPVKGVTVASKPVCQQAVRTDADGRFEVSWYTRSRIEKKFLLAQDIERNLAGLAELKEKSGPVNITLEPAFTLKGQVADPNGRGIARAGVQLRASLPGWITHAGKPVLTDAKGNYQINAIPPPQPDFSYRMEINAKNYGPFRLDRISFGDDPTEPVVIETVVLPPADQSISGVVVDSNDEPAAGVRIFLRGPNGSRTAGQPERGTVTDKQGRFFVNRVCKGPLRIQAATSSDPRGAGFLDAEGGDKDVKVVLGQRLVHVRYVSLSGKPLPDLKDLKIEIPTDDSDGKMMLVCFFDMEQRPSRNCIMELTKRAIQLEQEGVIVVTVQASKVDEKKLDEWVKKYNIPFPVGMIQDDEEKTRFAWGAKSLPSLILANKGHIVRAVGFGIGDLDEKLAGIHKPITKEEIEKHQREVAEAEIRRLGGEIIVKTSEDGSEYTEVKFLGPRYHNEWKGGNSGAKYLNGLYNLKNLRIQGVETFTDEGMVYLEGLNNLESLTLGRTGVSNDGLAHIKDLVNLEFLSLSSNKFTDAGLEHITEMTELKSLRLDDAQITNEGLRRLKQSGLLTRLEFLVLNRTQITDAGLAYLQGMDRLKLLYLSETQVGDEGISNLATLSKLEGIILNDTSITDAGLAYLKGLGNLNMLYLVNTQITNAGLAHLEKMTNLVQLWIGGTRITDTGLVYLKALNKLESLDLSHTQVTNSGLAHLEGLTSLKELFLKYSGVTIDGYLDLNKALPDCKIYWEQNVLEQRLVHVRYVSLSGKPLPDLKDLKIEIPTDDSDGKMMLVCFFDMEQRPSRNCIMRLARQAQQLKQKGVSVVAVQASKIDQDALNEWTKKYNIPFPVGMIEGDEEEIRFAWGVKSMPWLILTDLKHIVLAEGFGLDQLESKIQEAVGANH